nr:hypothetical protein [uncultured Rhodopila sp.]
MNTATSFPAFCASDLKTLAAIQAHPRRSGWAFHFDRDEPFDLIAINSPTAHRAYDPFFTPPCWLIAPAKAGQAGVRMTLPDMSTEVAYGSLADALRAVGGPGVAWKRALC